MTSREPVDITKQKGPTMTTSTTTDDPGVELGAAIQARALGLLLDGRVWSRGELAEQLAEDVESGTPAFTVTLARALDCLIEVGLAHEISGELLSASRRGMAAREGVDPGDGGVLAVPESRGGIGLVEVVSNPNAPDWLDGGAEHLPGGLEQLVGRGGRRVDASA